MKYIFRPGFPVLNVISVLKGLTSLFQGVDQFVSDFCSYWNSAAARPSRVYFCTSPALLVASWFRSVISECGAFESYHASCLFLFFSACFGSCWVKYSRVDNYIFSFWFDLSLPVPFAWHNEWQWFHSRQLQGEFDDEDFRYSSINQNPALVRRNNEHD